MQYSNIGQEFLKNILAVTLEIKLRENGSYLAFYGG